MVEVRGELTERDFLRAQWLHIKPRRGFQILGYAVLVLFLVVLAIAVATEQESLQPAATLLAPVIALAGVGVLYRYVWVRTYRRQPALQGIHTFAFSPDGIVSSSTLGDGRVRWAAFTKWREDRHVFLLYQGDNLFNIIPKRWILDGSALSELRALIAEHVRNRVG